MEQRETKAWGSLGQLQQDRDLNTRSGFQDEGNWEQCALVVSPTGAIEHTCIFYLVQRKPKGRGRKATR